MIRLGLGLSVIKGIQPQEAPPVFQGANAADPFNEVNGVANTLDNGQMIITSSAVDPQNGSYSLLFQQNAGVNTLADAYITLVGVTVGQDVTVSFYAKQIVGLAWTTRLATDGANWNSTVSGPLNDAIAGTWEQISIRNIAAKTDPVLNIRGTSSSDTGDQIAIDNIVITVH